MKREESWDEWAEDWNDAAIDRILADQVWSLDALQDAVVRKMEHNGRSLIN